MDEKKNYNTHFMIFNIYFCCFFAALGSVRVQPVFPENLLGAPVNASHFVYDGRE